VVKARRAVGRVPRARKRRRSRTSPLRHCGCAPRPARPTRSCARRRDSPAAALSHSRPHRAQDRASPSVVAHLDRCLDCRAERNRLSATVKYGESSRRPGRSSSRRARSRPRALRALLCSRRPPARLAQTVLSSSSGRAALGLTALGAALARLGLLPRRLAALAADPPRVASARSAAFTDDDLPASGARQAASRCSRLRRRSPVADVQRGDGARATREWLRRRDLRASRCCGALHIPTGGAIRPNPGARERARLRAGGYDAIVSNARGCGAELRHYGRVAAGSPRPRRSAPACATSPSSCVSSASAAAGHGRHPPGGSRTTSLSPLHAQKVSEPPKHCWRAIGGMSLVHSMRPTRVAAAMAPTGLQQTGALGEGDGGKLDAIRRSVPSRRHGPPGLASCRSATPRAPRPPAPRGAPHRVRRGLCAPGPVTSPARVDAKIDAASSASNLEAHCLRGGPRWSSFRFAS